MAKGVYGDSNWCDRFGCMTPGDNVCDQWEPWATIAMNNAEHQIELRERRKEANDETA